MSNSESKPVVRVKMQLDEVRDLADGTRSLAFTPVPSHQAAENAEFYKGHSYGSLHLLNIKSEGASHFKAGEQYFADITLAPKSEVP